MLKILKNKSQIDESRSKLRQLGLDTSVGIKRIIFKVIFAIRFRRKPPEISINKSWDVFEIQNAVRNHYHDSNIKIFEMGSFNSEIPLVLWELGYKNIRASDLNPLGRCINWYLNNIEFACEDFYSPAIPNESLDVMTCLSVIEHGYDQKKFLELCVRYLKKGGTVFLTTDYCEDKISVPEDFKIFNLSYKIFCKTEIENLIQEARSYGLAPLGNLEWAKSENPIEFEGYKFTFLLLALRKI